MAQQIILDSNVLIYAFDTTSPYNLKCSQIFNLPNIDLFITQNSLWELYRVMTSKAFVRTVTHADLLNIIEFYQNNLKILYPTQNTDFILNDLIEKYKPRSGQIWDMLILAIAMENDINTVYTKNVKDFPENKFIKIVDPTL